MTPSETPPVTVIDARLAVAAPAPWGRWSHAVARFLRGEWLAELFGSEDLADVPCSRAPWLADECALEHLYQVVSDRKDR